MSAFNMVFSLSLWIFNLFFIYLLDFCLLAVLRLRTARECICSRALFFYFYNFVTSPRAEALSACGAAALPHPPRQLFVHTLNPGFPNGTRS